MNETLGHELESSGFYKSLPWWVVANCHMGHRCGYVGVPLYLSDLWNVLEMKMEPESFFGNIYEQVITCHGGITFCSAVADKFWDIPGQEDMQYRGLVIGFDCGHSGDLRDPTIMNKSDWQRLAPFFEGHAGQVRTCEFCIGECERIIEQLWLCGDTDELAAELRELEYKEGESLTR